MYNSPNSLDINIKNTNNTNTHINFNFNINSTLDKKFLSPPIKSVKEIKEAPSSITGRKIDNVNNNMINYDNSSTKYPILIEDSKKKPFSKTQIFSKNSPKNVKSLKTLGKTTSLSLMEKARLTKKTNGLLSKGLLSATPESVLKEIPKEQKQQIKTKKKGKKKGSSKKKKRPTSKEIEKNFKDLSNFQDIIKKNLQKYHIEKVIDQQKKEEEIQLKHIKQQSLHIKNQSIRKLNSHSLTNKNQGNPPKFPWGFNQKKFLSFFEKLTEKTKNSQKNSKPNSLWLDDKLRRERLGLGFLNEMNFDDFQKLIHKPKPETSLEREERKAPKEKDPEIINWMIEKKRRVEEERWNSIKNMLEEQQRIRKNIQELEIKVSNSRNSVNSTGNNRSKYAKSSHYLANLQDFNNNNINAQNEYNKELAEKEESQIYDLIQKQLQQMVYSSGRNEQDNLSTRHCKSKSEDLQGKILQKKYLFEKSFCIIS